MMIVKCAINTNLRPNNNFIKYVAKLGKELDAQVQFVGAHNFISGIDQPTSILGDGLAGLSSFNLQERWKRSEQIMHDIADLARNIYSKIGVSLGMGDVRSRAQDDQSESDSELWIVGIHSHPSYYNEVMGTLETDLCKNLDSPVLSVPDEVDVEMPNKALILVGNGDGNKPFATLRSLFQKLKIKPNFIVEMPDEMEPLVTPMAHLSQQLASPIKSVIGSIEFFSKQNVFQAFERKMTEIKPNLLVMLNTHKSMMSRIFSNHNTNHFVLSSEVPVVVA